MKFICTLIVVLCLFGCASHGAVVQPESSYTHGVVSLKAGEKKEAKGLLEKAVQENPKDPWTYYALGFVLMELESNDEAVGAYSHAIALSTNNTPLRIQAYIGQGVALHQKKDFAGAVKAYNEALKMDRGNLKAFYNRGCAYGMMKEYSKALADFAVVLANDPQHASARNNTLHYASKI